MSEPGYAARYQGFLEQLGVAIPALTELEAALAASFTVEHFGFRQLSDIGDERLRAIVSDVTRTAAGAVLTNLVEARLALALYQEGAAAGIAYSADIRFDSELEANVGEFFRAIGSALDCLAAVVVGVLRVPTPIHRASFERTIERIGGAPGEAPSSDQADAWATMAALVERLTNDPQPDWARWALRYRDSVVHRPRQVAMMASRRVRAEVVLADPSSARDLIRADLHLRRKPWLPDLQHLAGPESSVEDLLLPEPATATMERVFDATRRLASDVASELLSTWRRIEAGTATIPAPASWAIERDQELAFRGFSPNRALDLGSAMVGHPATAQRLELAERLRHLAESAAEGRTS